MCIAIAYKTGCDVINFDVNLIFLIKPFFLHDQKVMTKTQVFWERKKLLRWNKKHFSSFIRAFSQANNTYFFRGWESDFKGVILWCYVLYYFLFSKMNLLHNLSHLVGYENKISRRKIDSVGLTSLSWWKNFLRNYLCAIV